MKMFRSACRYSYSFFCGIVAGIPIYITVNDYLFSIARVEGTSMQPTLNPGTSKSGDYVLLNRWCVNYEDIKHGDIVAITSPRDFNTTFVKRIIGVEGDYVRTPRYKHNQVHVPRGHCWIEGDNSRSSLDSNSFGPVSVGMITALTTHVVWPPSRWQKLQFNVPNGRRGIIEVPARTSAINCRDGNDICEETDNSINNNNNNNNKYDNNNTRNNKNNDSNNDNNIYKNYSNRPASKVGQVLDDLEYVQKLLSSNEVEDDDDDDF